MTKNYTLVKTPQFINEVHIKFTGDHNDADYTSMETVVTVDEFIMEKKNE